MGLWGEFARQYTYQEFPQHFVLKKFPGGGTQWGIRKQGFALGRMYFVSPNAGRAILSPYFADRRQRWRLHLILSQLLTDCGERANIF